MNRKKNIIIIVLCMVLSLLTGCDGKNTKVVLHTGFARDEVFRVENMSCTLPEMMVYLTTTQNRYEKVYGKQIWETNLEGVTLEESMKDMVLAQISQVKAMNLLAQKEQVMLSREEEEKVSEATQAFYETLSKEEMKLLEIDKEDIRRLYQEYATANKIYDYLIRDINPEVSDDEARTITIAHILIKTYTLDDNNRKIEFPKEQKQQAYERALEVLKKAQNGESFDTLISTYNEDKQSQYSFRKGEMDPEFETVAFNLGKGEISNIVETEYGFHVIKCITTFNQEETDANKNKIVEKKRKEVFEKHYSDFVKDITYMVNEKVWTEITLFEEGQVNTSEFFEIYEKYLGDILGNSWES